jgi:hypothetical protein
MFTEKEVQDFLKKDLYCEVCSKKLDNFDELRIQNPFDLQNVKMIHSVCYEKSHFLRKEK